MAVTKLMQIRQEHRFDTLDVLATNGPLVG